MTEGEIRRRMAEIEAEERALEFGRFGFGDARAVGERMLAIAPGPVSVRVQLGNRLAYAGALDGAAEENDRYAELKLRTVFYCAHSSLWFHFNLRARGRVLSDVPTMPPGSLIDSGGAVPIRVSGLVVGAAALSGLPHEEDHAIVVEALRQQLGSTGD